VLQSFLSAWSHWLGDPRWDQVYLDVFGCNETALTYVFSPSRPERFFFLSLVFFLVLNSIDVY